ncbi:MAG TPA: ATP-binding protein [Trebonia sp.]|nr:ATP-binding protein [Trebonia sp.]
MEVTGAHAVSPYHRSPGSWLRRDYLELRAVDTAPGSARAHVVNVLGEWRLAELAEPAELVVSELVTNSVLATRAAGWPARQPPVRLWLLSDRASVLVHVWDAIEALPTPGDAGTDDESGRGLAIVAALSDAWDSYQDAAFGGKVTWALITPPG